MAKKTSVPVAPEAKEVLGAVKTVPTKAPVPGMDGVGAKTVAKQLVKREEEEKEVVSDMDAQAADAVAQEAPVLVAQAAPAPAPTSSDGSAAAAPVQAAASAPAAAAAVSPLWLGVGAIGLAAAAGGGGGDEPAPVPTYKLQASTQSVNEGEKAVFVLTTTHVPNGTQVAYTVRGVSADDISGGQLTGVAVVQNGIASIEINLKADGIADGVDNLVVELDGKSVSATMTVNDTSVPLPVGAISDVDGAEGGAVLENAERGTLVGITAKAEDPNAGDQVSYSLTTNPGNLFAIDATTGVITVNGAIDYETATEYSVTVTARSNDGSSSVKTLRIAVTNVNDNGISSFVDADTKENAIARGAEVGAPVGLTASAEDKDSGGLAVNYKLVTSNGGEYTGPFEIDSATGEVSVKAPLDDLGSSVQLFVQANSEDGSSAIKAFDIEVVDYRLTSSPADNIKGSAYDDFIVGIVVDNNDSTGTVSTYQPGDQIDGGDGVDTLKLDVTAGSSVNSAVVKNVEKLMLGVGSDTVAGPTTVFMTHWDNGLQKSLEKIDIQSSKSFLTIAEQQSLADISIRDLNTSPTAQSQYEFYYSAGVLNGSDDALNLSLDNVNDPDGAKIATSLGIDSVNIDVKDTLGAAFASNVNLEANGAASVEVTGGKQGQSFRLNADLVKAGADFDSTEFVGNMDLESDKILTARFGDGDDKVVIDGQANDSDARYNLGEGDNTIDINDVDLGGAIIAGDGKNTVNVNNVAPNGNVLATGSITLGDGGNTVKIDADHAGAVTTGFGADTVTAKTTAAGSTIAVGEGNNSVEIEQAHAGSISAGDGNNTIAVGSTTGETEVEEETIPASEILLGNGDNRVTVEGDHAGNMTAGDGNNLVFAQANVVEHATLGLGDGNNVVEIAGEIDGATGEDATGVVASLGNGDNTVTVGGSVAAQVITLTTVIPSVVSDKEGDMAFELATEGGTTYRIFFDQSGANPETRATIQKKAAGAANFTAVALNTTDTEAFYASIAAELGADRIDFFDSAPDVLAIWAYDESYDRIVSAKQVNEATFVEVSNTKLDIENDQFVPSGECQTDVENATVTFGDGTNFMQVDGSVINSRIEFGNGDENELIVGGNVSAAVPTSIVFGDGKENTLTIGGNLSGDDVVFGDGADNSFDIGGNVINGASITLGDGGNSGTIAGDVTTGSTITFGDGADELTIGALGASGNTAEVSGVDVKTTISMGAEDDQVTLFRMSPNAPDVPVIVQSGAFLDGGADNDTLTLKAEDDANLIERTAKQVVTVDFTGKTFTVGQVVRIDFTRDGVELTPITYKVSEADFGQGPDGVPAKVAAALAAKMLNESAGGYGDHFAEAQRTDAKLTITSDVPHEDFEVTSSVGDVDVVQISDTRITSFETLELVALDSDGVDNIAIGANFDLIDGTNTMIDGTNTIKLDSLVERVATESGTGNGVYTEYSAGGVTTFDLDNLKGGEAIHVAAHETGATDGCEETGTGNAQVSTITVGTEEGDHVVGDKIVVSIAGQKVVYTVTAADLSAATEELDANNIATSLASAISSAATAAGMTVGRDDNVLTLVGQPGVVVEINVAHTRAQDVPATAVTNEQVIELTDVQPEAGTGDMAFELVTAAGTTYRVIFDQSELGPQNQITLLKKAAGAATFSEVTLRDTNSEDFYDDLAEELGAKTVEFADLAPGITEFLTITVDSKSYDPIVSAKQINSAAPFAAVDGTTVTVVNDFDWKVGGVSGELEHLKAGDVITVSMLGFDDITYTVTEADCERLEADGIVNAIVAHFTSEGGESAAAFNFGSVSFAQPVEVSIVRPAVSKGKTAVASTQAATVTDDGIADVVINATLAEGATDTTMDLTVDGHGNFDIAITGGEDSAYTDLDLKLGDTHDHTIDTGGIGFQYIPAIFKLEDSENLPFDYQAVEAFDLVMNNGDVVRLLVDYSQVNGEILEAFVSTDGGATFEEELFDASGDYMADWVGLYNAMEERYSTNSGLVYGNFGPNSSWLFAIETAKVYAGSPDLEATTSVVFESSSEVLGNFRDSITVSDVAGVNTTGSDITLDNVLAHTVTSTSNANLTIDQYEVRKDTFGLLGETITVTTGNGDDHLTTLAQSAMETGSTINLGTGSNTLSLGWGEDATLDSADLEAVRGINYAGDLSQLDILNDVVLDQDSTTLTMPSGVGGVETVTFTDVSVAPVVNTLQTIEVTLDAPLPVALLLTDANGVQYRFVSKGNIFADDPVEITRSTDGGETFEAVDLGLPEGYSLEKLEDALAAYLGADDVDFEDPSLGVGEDFVTITGAEGYVPFVSVVRVDAGEDFQVVEGGASLSTKPAGVGEDTFGDLTVKGAANDVAIVSTADFDLGRRDRDGDFFDNDDEVNDGDAFRSFEVVGWESGFAGDVLDGGVYTLKFSVPTGGSVANGSANFSGDLTADSSNEKASATVLGSGVRTVNGQLSGVADTATGADLYKFTHTGGALDIELFGDLDSNLILFNAAGVPVEGDDDGGMYGAESGIYLADLAAGDYYIAVGENNIGAFASAEGFKNRIGQLLATDATGAAITGDLSVSAGEDANFNLGNQTLTSLTVDASDDANVYIHGNDSGTVFDLGDVSITADDESDLFIQMNLNTTVSLGQVDIEGGSGEDDDADLEIEHNYGLDLTAGDVSLQAGDADVLIENNYGSSIALGDVAITGGDSVRENEVYVYENVHSTITLQSVLIETATMSLVDVVDNVESSVTVAGSISLSAGEDVADVSVYSNDNTNVSLAVGDTVSVVSCESDAVVEIDYNRNVHDPEKDGADGGSLVSRSFSIALGDLVLNAGEDANVDINENDDDTYYGDLTVSAGKVDLFAYRDTSLDIDYNEQTTVALGTVDMLAGEDADIYVYENHGFVYRFDTPNGNLREEVDYFALTMGEVNMVAARSADLDITYNTVSSITVDGDVTLTALGEDATVDIADNRDFHVVMGDVTLAAAEDGWLNIENNYSGEDELGEDDSDLVGRSSVELGAVAITAEGSADVLIEDNNDLAVSMGSVTLEGADASFEMGVYDYMGDLPISEVEVDVTVAGDMTITSTGEDGSAALYVRDGYDSSLVVTGKVTLTASGEDGDVDLYVYDMDDSTVRIAGEVEIRADDAAVVSIDGNDDSTVSLLGGLDIEAGGDIDIDVDDNDGEDTTVTINGVSATSEFGSVSFDIYDNNDATVSTGAVTLAGEDSAGLYINDNEDATITLGAVSLTGGDALLNIGEVDDNDDALIKVGTVDMIATENVASVYIYADEEETIEVGDLTVHASDDVDFYAENYDGVAESDVDTSLELGDIYVRAGSVWDEEEEASVDTEGEDADIDFYMESVIGTETIHLQTNAGEDSEIDAYIIDTPDLHTVTMVGGDEDDTSILEVYGAQGNKDGVFTIDMSDLTSEVSVYTVNNVSVDEAETYDNVDLYASFDAGTEVRVLIGGSDLVEYNVQTVNAGALYLADNGYSASAAGYVSMGVRDLTPVANSLSASISSPSLGDGQGGIWTFNIEVDGQSYAASVEMYDEDDGDGFYIYWNLPDAPTGYEFSGSGGTLTVQGPPDGTGQIELTNPVQTVGSGLGTLDFTPSVSTGDPLEDGRGLLEREIFTFTGDDIGDVVIGGFNPGEWNTVSPINSQVTDRLDFSQFEGVSSLDDLVFDIDDTGPFANVVIDFKDDDLGSITLVGAGEYTNAIDLVQGSIIFA